MLKSYTTRPINEFWDFDWTEGADSLVFFSNPKANTNVIYTLEELQKIVGRSDKENSFIPVPRATLEEALGAHLNGISVAA